MAIKVGLIGCGGIARQHLRGWEAEAQRAEVVALVDPVAENRARFKQRVPDAKEYTDYEEMIAAEKLDAVDICLPHHLHLPSILSSIKAGLHWLSEKPLCLSLDEADRIESAMKDAKLVGMSAHNQTFMPSILEAKRLICEGQIGEVYTIISEDCFILGMPALGALPGAPVRSPIAAGTWRAKKEQMGGGELIDTGYHPTYRMLFLAGAEPTTVAAVLGKYRNKHLPCEDTATVVVGFDSGVTGLIRTSWAMETPADHHPFHVVGERGELYGGDNELFFKPARFGEPAKMTFNPVDEFVAEVGHFVDCIEQGLTPVQSYVDGIRVLRVIRRAYDFAESGAGKA